MILADVRRKFCFMFYFIFHLLFEHQTPQHLLLGDSFHVYHVVGINIYTKKETITF